MQQNLTSRHYSILRVAKAQLGLSEDDYRAILLRLTGQESAKMMDTKGFQKVMTHFEKIGFVSTAKRKDFSRQPGKATEAQLRKIAALWSEFTDGTGDEAGLRRWMANHGHGNAPTWLNRSGAQKVIAALLNMVGRRDASRA